MNHLNEIKDRIIAEFSFICQNGVHIGAGESIFRKDVLKISDEHVVIPASSWKGSFRAISERLMYLTKTNNKIISYILSKKLYVEDRHGVGLKIEEKDLPEIINLLREATGDEYTLKSNFIKLAGVNNSLINNINKAKSIEDIIQHPDTEIRRGIRSIISRYLAIIFPITSLYGGAGIAGKMRFIDTLFRAHLHIKTSIGINRKTRTAEENRLYDIVIAYPTDNRVKLRILMDNIKNGSHEEKHLLKNTIDYIKTEGIQIGGNKSRGTGYLKLAEKETIFKVLESDKERDILVKLGEPERWETKSLEKFLKWLMT